MNDFAKCKCWFVFSELSLNKWAVWLGGQARLTNATKGDSPVKLFFHFFPLLCGFGRNSPRKPCENSLREDLKIFTLCGLTY